MNMNTILRTFFYSFGIAMLVCTWMLNPETAQFKDLVQILHLNAFWQLVGLFAILLIGADMLFAGKITGFPDRTKPAVGSGR